MQNENFHEKANLRFVPDEHMELVERALESSLAGQSTPMTDADWEHLHLLAVAAAARSDLNTGGFCDPGSRS